MWRRQALRDKASLWSSPGRQPPLFFFMRDDILAYFNKVGHSFANRSSKASCAWPMQGSQITRGFCAQ